MDFVIKAKQLGEKGGLQKAINQTVKSQTLEGVIEQPLCQPLYLNNNNKIINNNSKIESINNKTEIKKEELIIKLEKLINEQEFDKEFVYGYMDYYLQFATYYYSEEEMEKINQDLRMFKIK
jgi:hypothetical protein